MRALFLTVGLLFLAACEQESSAMHLARAKDYLATPDYAAAIIELKNALVLEGNSAEARWLLGEAYLETGEILSAEKELRRAEELGWSAEDVRPALAKTLLAQGKVEDVLSLEFEDLGDPAAARLLSTQAMSALSDQQHDKARELVALARNKAPQLRDVKLAQADARRESELSGENAAEDSANVPQTDILKILNQVAKKDFDTAINTAQSYQGREPEGLAPINVLDRLYYAAGQHDKARESFELAEYAMRSGTPEKIEPLFAELSELQRRSPRVLQLTGAAQLALRQYTSARVTLQQWVEEEPDSAQAHYLLGLAANATGDAIRSKQALEDAVAHDPVHVPALVGLAKVARFEGNREQFDQYIARLVELAPDSPEVLRLRALQAQAGGDSDKALELSQQAFEQAPGTQSALELASLQKAAGKSAAAHNTLEQWIKEYPNDIDARLSLANTLLHGNDEPGAREQYLAVLELDPENFTALNNLAWTLRQDDPEMALAYIRQAAELAPDQPALLDTLAVVEFYNGQYASARRNIQRALSAMPENPSMRYHDAMIAATLGETEQAVATLEDLIEIDASEFPERSDAQAQLEILKG